MSAVQNVVRSIEIDTRSGECHPVVHKFIPAVQDARATSLIFNCLYNPFIKSQQGDSQPRISAQFRVAHEVLQVGAELELVKNSSCNKHCMQT